MKDFMSELEKIDAESSSFRRNTLVSIKLEDGIEYKFMTAAGAIWATIVYGPQVSLVI
jgi:hypothetical protein